MTLTLDTSNLSGGLVGVAV